MHLKSRKATYGYIAIYFFRYIVAYMILNESEVRFLSYSNERIIAGRFTEADEDFPLPDKYCPVCDSENPEVFYINLQTDECVGCSECINTSDWQEFD